MSSTSSLWYAWDQYEQMTLFRQNELKPLSNQLLPRYFTAFFSRGVPRVLGLLAATTFSCGAILRSSSGMLKASGAYSWYIGGLCLALAHLAWVPFIVGPVQAIEKDAKEHNVTHLDNWLRLHVWRTLTVDICAWICCIMATIASFS
ncbi:hypothetical protein F5Y16DRAFT_414701 [Xylariaceae sp. FL0255]|nr:hypothetical protein F5Y16DRAFT_414701 [Xylariaceae sp. FL0255]